MRNVIKNEGWISFISVYLGYFPPSFNSLRIELPEAGWNLAGADPPIGLEVALAGAAGLAGMLALAFSSMANTWSLEVG